MNTQFSDKTGEPWAVNPRFLSLQPKILHLPNLHIKPKPGFIGSRQQIEGAYRGLLEFATDCVRSNRMPEGFAYPVLTIFCLNQVFTVTFVFKVKNGEVVEPPLEDAIRILGGKLNQLFN